ncbi:MAG TPA: hypothetical protein VJA21_07725 [Verrucomicrobiae bacterium]
MALKLFTKADLVAGAIFLGLFGLLLLVMAVLGDQFLLSRIRVSGTVLTPDHPDFPRYLSILRWAAGLAAILCWIFGWLSFRCSRSIAN